MKNRMRTAFGRNNGWEVRVSLGSVVEAHGGVRCATGYEITMWRALVRAQPERFAVRSEGKSRP